jgi:ATP-binding cassette subfamily B protein
VKRLRGQRDRIRTLGRSVALVAGLAPGASAAYVIVTLVAGGLAIAQVWLAKVLIEALVARAADRALALTAAYVATIVIPPTLGPLEDALIAWLEDRTVREVDRRLMQAGDRATDLGLIERPGFHDELEVVEMSVIFAAQLLRVVATIGTSAVVLAGVLVLLGRLHPLLPVALAAVALPHLLFETRYFQLAYEALGVRARDAREMEYYAQLATEPRAAAEVRVFGLGGFLISRYRQRYQSAFREVRRLRLSYLRTATVFALLHALALAGGFWYVASRAAAGRLTLGDLALYVNGIIQAEALLAMLPGWTEPAYTAVLHLRGLFRFLDRARPTVSLPVAGQGLPAPERLREGIELREVSFSYPESTHPVLDGVSLTVQARQVTALVGPNGAGKSTLVKLLTRMYAPQSGEITLDGVPLPEYDLGSLRSRIAVVYQDFARFSLSLKDNIAVGAGSSGDGEVQRGARWAGVDELVAELPDGYDTELTRRFEGGVELSGGQWQKVGLARGFVRDAALVVLDEPTSALDAEAEYQLFCRFKELMAGRTTLLISHRFSTVRMADRIIVLEGGHVLEEGTHEELIARRGRYAELFEMQAGRYR